MLRPKMHSQARVLACVTHSHLTGSGPLVRMWIGKGAGALTVSTRSRILFSGSTSCKHNQP